VAESCDDVSAFQRTPERIATDLARLERETEAEKIRDERFGAPFLLKLKREREEGSLGDLCASLMKLTSGVEERRRNLPCYPALQDDDDEHAIAACEAVKGYEGCEWAKVWASCPRLRAPDIYDAVLKRLGAGQVETRESELLRAAARSSNRVPLLELDSLVFVRSALRRKRMRVAFEDAAEVDAAGATRPNEAFLTGTEAILVLGGNQGRGKTLAACYAIARLGGYYTRAPAWARRDGVDYDLALAAPVLVVDQLGREDWGSNDWARSQFEDVIDARYQRRRLTVFVGNLLWQEFVHHFDKHLNRSTLRDRVFGDGVFVIFGGESLRASLRLERLAGTNGRREP
jgi:hypothetical protein